VEKAFKVEITFVGADANSITATMRIPYSEFIKEMRIGVVSSLGHYAVFNINLPEFQSIPSLKLSVQRNFSIGSLLAVLTFNHGYSNLGLKTGIISSVFANREGVRFIQYDGLLNYGNSGSPLIDTQTFEVVGIVSRRSTPLANAYNQLMGIITDNLTELKKVEASVKFGDIDPIQVLIANQNQLKQLAKVIYKHTASGISNAVMLDSILSFFNNDTIAEPEAKQAKEEFDLYQNLR
ncbi:MAG: serine protease, partial [Bacteroidales bacterium]|nr:serine protease [Bacteroidales bacterium]